MKKEYIYKLLLFVLLITNISFSQCIVADLAKDLRRNPELKKILLSNNKNYKAWTILHKHVSKFRSSSIEIKFLANHIDEINKIGYEQWVSKYNKIANRAPSGFFSNTRKVTQEELFRTFDPDGKLGRHHRGLIYNYFNQAVSGNKTHLWKKIELIFEEYKLNDGWPPYNGGYNVKKHSFEVGAKFDRYQKWFALNDGKPIFGGAYTSPIRNKKIYTFSERALKGLKKDYSQRYVIKILKKLPIEGEIAKVIPWFKHSGGGEQVLFKFNSKYKNFQDLIDGGFIEIIIRESPNKLCDLTKYGKAYSSLAKGGSNWFSLSSFKNITAKIPGGANKTNIGKKLWNDAYKITPINGSSAKSVVDDIIANGDILGLKTEGLVDDIMTGQRYQIADGKYYGANGVNGYDGIYYKGAIENPSEIIIIESKQMSSRGSASLNGPKTNTGLPSQMSDNWINYVATNKLDGLGGLKQQTADAIISASNGLIQKYVVVVDKITGDINFLKLANF